MATAAYGFAEEICRSESTVTSVTAGAHTFALCQSRTASDATTQLPSFCHSQSLLSMYISSLPSILYKHSHQESI